MALAPRKQIRPKVKAGNLNFSNLEKRHPNPPVEDDDVVVENAATVHVLVDPESVGAGDLHFSNHEKKPAARKVRAAAKPARKLTVKLQADTVNDAFEDTTNVGLLPNDADPEEGYKDGDEDDTTFLTNAQNDEDGDQFIGDDDDADLDYDNVDGPEDDEGEDVDASDDGDDVQWDEDEDDETSELPAPNELSATKIVSEADQPEDPSALPLAEIRKVDDTVKNLAFVMNGDTLLAVKDTTVVASMSKSRAVNASIDDVYTTAAYHGLLRQEVRKHGLLAALAANGFRTERVNLYESRLMARALKQETTKIEARLNKLTASKQAAMDQSVQIAAVGINSNVFQSENTLRAALHQELSAAGIRNPERMLQRVFASHGHEYVADVLAVAASLADKSPEVRNDYAAMLDLTNGQNAVKAGTDTHDDDEDDSFEFENDTPAPVTAALMRRPTRVTASTGKAEATKVTASALAQAILRGDAPLF